MSEYIDIIKEAILFFPVIAFLFSIPFILFNYHKYGSISFIKTIILYSFILYLLCAYFLVILPLPDYSFVEKLTTPRVQLVPFMFIIDIIKEFSFKSFIFQSCIYVPLYNIILTIPFGIYLKYYKNTTIKKTIIYSFLLSLFFELTQLTGLYFIYPRGYRLFDIDDLMLNTLGGLIGYYISLPLLKIIPSKEEVNTKAKDIGKTKVSDFRKITIFIFDLTIYLFLLFISYLIINTRNSYLYIFILYYFIIPIFIKGRTLGELFLRTKVVDLEDNVNIIRTLLRRFLFVLFYIGFIVIISVIFIKLGEYMNTNIKILFALILASVTILFYGITSIKFIFTNKPLIYERLSKTKIISTIK